jgi:hypothetical protein
MAITLDRNQTPAMPASLYGVLAKELKSTNPGDANAITLHFRDPDYSAEAGGYHPVEILLEKQSDYWRMVYMTDFAFHGHPFPELVKDIDICFNSNQVYSSISGWLCQNEGKELVDLFTENFISYHTMDAYKVQVCLD